jgi:hypothetical protein
MEAQLDVRRRVKGLLQRLKLTGRIEALPAYVRDQFYNSCAPDPVLVFDPSFPPPKECAWDERSFRDERALVFRALGGVPRGVHLLVEGLLGDRIADRL